MYNVGRSRYYLLSTSEKLVDDDSPVYGPDYD